MQEDSRNHKLNLNSLDVLKLVMSIVVIAIHTDPTYYYNGEVKLVYNLICSFAVPVFFLASGYLISMKFKFSDSHDHIFIRQLKKDGILYVKWMLIYTPLLIVHLFLTNDKWNASLIINEGIKYFRNLILVGSQYNSYQLWYLLSLVYVLIIILLGSKNGKNSVQFLAILIIFVIFGTILRIFLIDGVGFELLRLISTVGLFCVVIGIKIGKDDSQIYITMRKTSTYIYLIHMYVWTIYYMIAYGQKTYGIDCFLVTSIVSIVISLTLIMYQRKIG